MRLVRPRGSPVGAGPWVIGGQLDRWDWDRDDEPARAVRGLVSDVDRATPRKPSKGVVFYLDAAQTRILCKYPATGYRLRGIQPLAVVIASLGRAEAFPFLGPSRVRRAPFRSLIRHGRTADSDRYGYKLIHRKRDDGRHAGRPRNLPHCGLGHESRLWGIPWGHRREVQQILAITP